MAKKSLLNHKENQNLKLENTLVAVFVEDHTLLWANLVFAVFVLEN